VQTKVHTGTEETTTCARRLLQVWDSHFPGRRNERMRFLNLLEQTMRANHRKCSAKLMLCSLERLSRCTGTTAKNWGTKLAQKRKKSVTNRRKLPCRPHCSNQQVTQFQTKHGISQPRNVPASPILQKLGNTGQSGSKSRVGSSTACKPQNGVQGGRN